ncbi:YeiH family protein [Pseudonocardia sp. HH130629-09]|uniref:YeiH family protein n=1 Tax=Pseudonocardia sp. HH130629-09 TaxID=1641402 RepID=UPI000A795D9A|nr:putative sulfate exporter family transporter [Pseudonocardia sp. HH130629-09]
MTDQHAGRPAEPGTTPPTTPQTQPETGPDSGTQASTRSTLLWGLGGVAVVLVLGGLVRFLEQTVPDAAEGTALSGIADAIEYPVYAIALGLLGNVVLTLTGLRERLSGGFRTEFFIKTGLVLLGASIDFSIIVRAAGPAVVQAVVLITVVFGFTWWLAGRAGVDDKLRALLASAVSICGVSAAIAAAGAVQARKEQLAYTASLVILFALPSIFLLPAAVGALGLSPAAAGAWIGGNIDTTAAVSAAGAIVGEEALQIATIVKTTQNALLGVVAVALTAYFTLKVERSGSAGRPGLREFWERFPKFVLGFLAASVIATVFVATAGSDVAKPLISDVNAFRTTFLILAFVSIGLEFRVAPLREAGWRPIGVFAAATGVNLAVGLGLAVLLFSGLTV